MQVPRVEYQKLRDMRMGESSAEVRARVEVARQHQRKRFEGTDIASNADMHPAQIRKYCALDDPCQALMKTAMRQLQLTIRAYHRVLKLSRTIGDFARSEPITQVHLAEALQYRPKLDSEMMIVLKGTRFMDRHRYGNTYGTHHLSMNG